MPEAERYTLDTSAVMAYFANEAGAEKVEAILSLAERELPLLELSLKPRRARARTGGP